MSNKKKYLFCLDWFGYISPLVLLLVTGDPFNDGNPVDWFIIASFPLVSWQLVRHFVFGELNLRPWKNNPLKNIKTK